MKQLGSDFRGVVYNGDGVGEYYEAAEGSTYNFKVAVRAGGVDPNDPNEHYHIVDEFVVTKERFFYPIMIALYVCAYILTIFLLCARDFHGKPFQK